MKRALRDKFPEILDAEAFGKVIDAENNIVNPVDTLFLRSTDRDAINACLVITNNIKGINIAVATRLERFRERSARIREFISKEYHL